MTNTTLTDDLIAEIELEIESAEQAAFEDWLEQKCPSGGADSVHAQWKGSAEFSDLCGDYPYISELLALTAELRSLRADADRYRWLRADCMSTCDCSLEEPQLVFFGHVSGDWQEAIDTAIDTAMKSR